MSATPIEFTGRADLLASLMHWEHEAYRHWRDLELWGAAMVRVQALRRSLGMQP